MKTILSALLAASVFAAIAAPASAAWTPEQQKKFFAETTNN